MVLNQWKGKHRNWLVKLWLSTLVLSLLAIAPITSYAAAPTGTMITGGAACNFEIGGGNSQTVYITSGGTEITAENDIRVKIPTTINAIWNTAATELAMNQPGTGVVSTTVTYPDNRTLLLNVTTNFASGETIAFTNTSIVHDAAAASPTARLQWSVDGGNNYGSGGDASTDCTVSAVTSSPPTINFSSGVVGATNTTTIGTLNIYRNAANTNAMVSGDKVTFTMPANWDVSGVTYTSDTFNGNPNFSACTAAGQVISCTASTTIAGNASGNILISGIKGSYVADAGTTAIAVVITSFGTNQGLYTGLTVNATTIGALSSTNVEPGSLYVGNTTNATISFTSTAAIPNLGKIIVTFPSGYNVSGANATTASSLSGLDGTWTASVSGQVVTLTQTGGSASAAGAKSLQLSNIVNPSTSGSTGTYTITTQIAAGNNIQTDAAVSADIILEGGNRSSGAPPTNTSITIVGAPTVSSHQVMLNLAATGAAEMRLSNDANFVGDYWETYSTSKPWRLVSGEGLKTVYAQFRDVRQNISPVIQASVMIVNPEILPISPPISIPSEITTSPTPSVVPTTSLFSNPSHGSGPRFTDISNHWASDFIQKLLEKAAIIAKTSENFSPDGWLTRAEMVHIILAIFNITRSPELQSTFPDISSTGQFYSDIVTAEAKGIINGYQDGSFKPNQLVTRAEAIKIILLASGHKVSPDKTSSHFDDVPTTAWYLKYINYAYNKQLVSGKTLTLFFPDDLITRAEIAKIVFNLSKLTNEEIN